MRFRVVNQVDIHRLVQSEERSIECLPSISTVSKDEKDER
jgi:hypothetical protein